MATAARISRCPACGKSCRTSADNPWRPFCGERCKLIDLGAWLDERYRVPGETAELPPEEPIKK
ncbi:MAG: DNA gyrase inhibitor YacG [Nevskiales bacterium]